MSEKENRTNLEWHLKQVSSAVNQDKFMLMEYLGPVVDGCRAALKVSVERAHDIHEMSESEFEKYMNATEHSLRDLTICFKATDVDEILSIVFKNGATSVHDECVEPDVVVSGAISHLTDIMNIDSRISPTDVIGVSVQVTGAESSDVVEALGFLCFPSLLKMARSGVDPSSLLSEDADSIIVAAASNLVAQMVRKWIDAQLEQH
ncbi:MAG: hypothetical protein RTU09_06560 [Candidatus Thorarchaeota archaeon]